MNPQQHSQTQDQQLPVDPYLWDRSSPADPGVRQLEEALATRRMSAGDQPVPAPARIVGRIGIVARGPAWAGLAVGLVMLFGALGLALLRDRSGFHVPATPATAAQTWSVEPLAGSPRIGAEAVGDRGRMQAGDWLTTDARSQATMSVPGVGRVTLDPNSRLRLVKAAQREQRLELASGTLHAFITAPPRLFAVDTPAGSALDMGCVYDLTVDPQGTSVLRVSLGWVELTGKAASSRVPAGYECTMARGLDPQLPRRAEAPAPLKAIVERIGAADRAADDDVDALLLAAAPADGATLWHLLSRAEGPARLRVAQHLSSLVPAPQGVTVAGAAAGDRDMLDRWWEEIRWAS